jgi:hypothetical protein
MRPLHNAEISEELVVSRATVKTPGARGLSKVDLCDQVQAVPAYDSGLVVAGGGGVICEWRTRQEHVGACKPGCRWRAV